MLSSSLLRLFRFRHQVLKEGAAQQLSRRTGHGTWSSAIRYFWLITIYVTTTNRQNWDRCPIERQSISNPTSTSHVTLTANGHQRDSGPPALWSPRGQATRVASRTTQQQARIHRATSELKRHRMASQDACRERAGSAYSTVAMCLSSLLIMANVGAVGKL